MDDEPEHRWGSRELARRLRSEMAEGLYQAGQQLPSYRHMATKYDLAVNTVREAIRLLEQEGKVVIRHGSGVYVSRQVAERSPEDQLREVRSELEDVREQLRRTGDALSEVESRLANVVDRIGRES